MSWMLDRKLAKVQQRLTRARSALQAAEAELQLLGEQGDEDRVRALVSDNAFEVAESRDSVRHADRAGQQVVRLRNEVQSLQRQMDELLDRRAGG